MTSQTVSKANLKFSIYNSILEIEGKHTLIFNAVSRKFLVLRNTRFISDRPDNEVMDNILRLPSLPELIRDKFIIDRKEDETGNLKRNIEEARCNASSFLLHINPSMDCNFNCWYCYENHKKGSKMNESTVNAVIKFIHNLLENNSEIRHLHIGFFGGEPFLGFEDVVKPLLLVVDEICVARDVKLSINFTTNGSLITDDAIEFLKKYDTGFQITLDGGQECHDKVRFFKGGKGSYRQILETIRVIAYSGMRVMLRINYTSGNVESVREILMDVKRFSEYEKTKVSIDLQRVWQDRTPGKDETETAAGITRQKLREAGFRVHANYIPSNASDPCYGDMRNHILINYDGNIFGCTARDFTDENSIGFLKQDGTVEYREDISERRYTAKFSKAICHKCRIAPLCGGGCSQRAFESNGSDGCIYGYSERDMDNLILDIFEHSFLKENNEINYTN